MGFYSFPLILTQLFFFINLDRVSSSLLLPPPMEGKAELSAACTLAAEDFLEDMEKSCTSLRSMAPELEADFNISAMFILGRLKKKKII